MDIQEKLNQLINLIREGWATFLAVIILMVPGIWLVAGSFYSQINQGEINGLKSKIEALEAQVETNRLQTETCTSQIKELRVKKNEFKAAYLKLASETIEY